MDKRLKISADTNEVKKSLLDLSKIAKRDLGKSNIQLFDKETNKLLKGEAKAALKDINTVSTNIKKEIEKQAVAIKKTTKGTKEYREEMTKLRNLSKELLTLEKDRADLQKVSGKGMGIKMPTGRLGGLASKFGLGAGIGGLALGGGLAMAGMAGAYGVSRMASGVQRFGQAVPNRLQLRGRGISDFNLSPEQRARAAKSGLSRNELEEQRLRSVGAFGRGGATTESVLQRSRFERGTGLETGTMTQIGGQIRGAMGGQRAGNAVMKMQASLIASGIDDAIGPYLDTAATMLMSINEQGLTNNTEILAALADLTKKTGESPEIIGKQLTGLDAALRSSSGERNAFLQSAFAEAGIGGGSILGTQAALRSGGAFGANLTGLTSEQQARLSEQGIGSAGFQERSGAILSKFKKSGFKFGQGSTAGEMLESGRGAMGFLGAKSETEGIRMLNLLEKASTGDKKAVQELQDMQKNPQLKHLSAIEKSNEGQLNAIQKTRESIESEIGEKLAPTVIKSQEALASIDETISRIAPKINSVASSLISMLEFFGVSSKEPTAVKGLNAEERAETYKTAEKEISRLQKKLADPKSYNTSDITLTGNSFRNPKRESDEKKLKESTDIKNYLEQDDYRNIAPKPLETPQQSMKNVTNTINQATQQSNITVKVEADKEQIAIAKQTANTQRQIAINTKKLANKRTSTKVSKGSY